MSYPKLSVASMKKAASTYLEEPLQPEPRLRDYDVLMITENGITLRGESGRSVRFASIDEKTIHISLRDTDGAQLDHQVHSAP